MLNESNLIIGGICGPNAGYVRTLYLVAADEVVDLIEPQRLVSGPWGDDAAVAVGGLLLKPGAGYTKVKFPGKACRFSEAGTPGDAGMAWTMGLDVSLPKNSLTLRDWLWRNAGRRWLAVFQDQNGDWYLLGDRDYPATWQVSAEVSVQNGVSIRLSCRSWHPAWSMSGLVLAEVPRPADEPILRNLLEELAELRSLVGQNGLVIEQRPFSELPAGTASSYAQITVGGQTYRITGKMRTVMRSAPVAVTQDNQRTFAVPTAALGKDIVAFCINNLDYEEGLDYRLSPDGSTIEWLANGFEISSTDGVRVKYFVHL